MKTSLFIFLCSILAIAISFKPEGNSMPSGLPVVPLADNAGDYRSGQLTEEQLKDVLQSDAINAVIRLNGDQGKDGEILSTADEQDLVESYFVEFYRFDAHSARDRAKLVKVLNERNALIHCRHGVHRTGAAVGQYLQQKGYTPAQIIAHLGWEQYNEQWRGKYREYYDIAVTPE